MMTATVLCPLDDIPDGGGRQVALAGDGKDEGEAAVVVLRRGERAWAYRNLCPHFSIPLNYEPDTFWTYEGEHLMCAHHSAMFRFEDGVCVDGPCVGAALTRVPVRVEGRLVVDGSPGVAGSPAAGSPAAETSNRAE